MRHYPHFRILRPSSERRRDFNPLDQCAAQRTLWAPPTPQLLRPLPRSLHLSEGARCSVPMPGSPWLPHNYYVRLDTVIDPGWSNTPCPFYFAPCLLLPAGVYKPSATSNAVISGLQPSWSTLYVTIAPRLLSCLRIKQPIAGLPRLGGCQRID